MQSHVVLCRWVRSVEGLSSSLSLHKSGCRLDFAAGSHSDLGAGHFTSHRGMVDVINPLLYFIHASEYNESVWLPPGALPLGFPPPCPAPWAGDPLPSTSQKGPWVRWLLGAVTWLVWHLYALPRHPALTPAARQSLPVTQPGPSPSPAGTQCGRRRTK